MTKEDLVAMQSELIVGLTQYDKGGMPRTSYARSRYLAGIEPRILDILSRMALGKRIEKIKKLLPITCAYLRPGIEQMAIAFASKHPPLSAESFYNACQFYGFLQRIWKVELAEPPFMPDVIYCELAVVAVGSERHWKKKAKNRSCRKHKRSPSRIPRSRAVRLRRCSYDIEALLDGRDRGGVMVRQRPVCLVVSRPLSAGKPKVFEVAPGVFELIRSLDRWVRQPCGQGDENRRALVFCRNLEKLGFIDVRQCESP